MLTDNKIKAAIKAATAGDKEITLADGSGGRGRGGLYIAIRAGKSPLWIARWTRDGKASKKSLGAFPTVSLAMAREKFRVEVADMLALNRDPRSHIPVTGEATFGLMLDGYLDVLRSRKASGLQDATWCLGKARAHIGESRPARDIEPEDIAAFLGAFFRSNTRSAADHARTYLHAAFNWAIMATNDYTIEGRRDWGMKSNPVSYVPKDTTYSEPREFSLTPAELLALWRGVTGEGFSFEVACAIRLVMICGQRVQETLRVEGCEIDLERGLWTMPRKKRKGGRKPGKKAATLKTHAVALPAQAVAIFKALKKVHGEGALFPARSCSKAELLGYQSVSRALARWLDRKGGGKGQVRPECQARDIRRTWKTLTEEAGVDLFMRDYIQQHAQGGTARQVYDQATYLSRMREAMAKWGAWLESKGMTEADAVPIRAAPEAPVSAAEALAA